MSVVVIGHVSLKEVHDFVNYVPKNGLFNGTSGLQKVCQKLILNTMTS